MSELAGLAPSLEDLAAIAERAFAALPAGFRQLAGEVLFRVDDFPSDEVLDELGIEDPFGLTGLYQGLDLGRRGFDAPAEPCRVFLYRRPILDYWCESDEDLPHIVRHVLIHEIGHHFGLSDDDMEAIEAKAEEESQRAQPSAN